MARGKWINKKSATTYQLVHRPQNDPRIHDEDAPQVLLSATSGSSKSKHLDDLASEFAGSCGAIRDNEGEAAEHGIYFDDTEYDYMQHLREPGSGGGNIVFVPATAPRGKDKNKNKDGIIEIREPAETNPRVDPDMLPTPNLPKLSYQSQQNVPDYIAGFQPDMDPRLREVLEALDDDEAIDDDDDLFQELAKDGVEVSAHEFEDSYYDDGWYDEEEEEGEEVTEDAGYESDRTVKAAAALPERAPEQPIASSNATRPSDELADDAAGGTPSPETSSDWMEHFQQFKRDQQKSSQRKLAGPAASAVQSSIMSTTTNGGRRKKRKGALTNPSTYSMTSSSLVRTEHMTILDARFDKIDEEYRQDDDDEDEGDIGDDSARSAITGMSCLSTVSSVTGSAREDFDDILDEYLGASQGRTRHFKKDKAGKAKRAQEGIAALDELRRGLGPPHIKGRA